MPATRCCRVYTHIPMNSAVARLTCAAAPSRVMRVDVPHRSIECMCAPQRGRSSSAEVGRGLAAL